MFSTLRPHVISVSGDNNLKNVRQSDQTWKVRMIEKECKQLLLDAGEV
jgi:hypothetical protein